MPTAIPDLPNAAALSGTEDLPVEQAGVTKRSQPSALATFLGFVAGILPLAKGGTGGNDAATARTSLDVYSKAQVDAAIPTVPSFASAAEIQAGTSTTKVTSPKGLADAATPQVLVDGATVNWDMAAGFNAKVTLGGNRTLAAPTNFILGMTYALGVIQDATGSRTVTWDAAYDFGSAGAPTLSTAATKRDLVFMYCYDATVGAPKFRCSFNKSA